MEPTASEKTTALQAPLTSREGQSGDGAFPVASNPLPSADPTPSSQPNAPPAAPTIRSIIRQTSNSLLSQLGGPVVPTFFCQICLERQPSSDAFFLGCGHRFDRECLVSYITAKINEGITTIPCCYDTKDGNSSGDSAPASSAAPAPDADPSNVTVIIGTGESSTAVDVPAAGVGELVRSPAAASAAAASSSTAAPVPTSPSSPGTAVVLPGPAGSPVHYNDAICRQIIKESDIQQLLASQPELMAKYRRFAAVAQNPNLRECPFCHAYTAGTEAQPRITCSGCSKEFCYLHSNAHEGKSCAAYEKSQREEQKVNEALMNADSKPCPQCGMRIYKAGGCNAMKCRCGCSFCYLCGQQIDSGELPRHYQWYNVTGCPGRQMQAENSSCVSKYLHPLGMFLAMLVVGPPTVALTLLLSIFCFPCLIRKPRDGGEGEGFFARVLGMSEIIFFLLCSFLALLISITVGLVLGVLMCVPMCMCPCFFRNCGRAGLEAELVRRREQRMVSVRGRAGAGAVPGAAGGAAAPLDSALSPPGSGSSGAAGGAAGAAAGRRTPSSHTHTSPRSSAVPPVEAAPPVMVAAASPAATAVQSAV